MIHGLIAVESAKRFHTGELKPDPANMVIMHAMLAGA